MPTGIQIRKLTRPELDPHSRRRGIVAEKVLVVRRLRRDFPPGTVLDTPCVIWQGSADRNGYGRRKVLVGVEDGERVWKTISMHRWVMEQVLGRQLSSDETVMHRCDNPICYRVDHLRIGSIRLNNLDMFAKKRNVLPPRTVRYGTDNGNSTIPDDTVEEALSLIACGWSQARVAIHLGISTSHINRIVHGHARRKS